MTRLVLLATAALLAAIAATPAATAAPSWECSFDTTTHDFWATCTYGGYNVSASGPLCDPSGCFYAHLVGCWIGSAGGWTCTIF